MFVVLLFKSELYFNDLYSFEIPDLNTSNYEPAVGVALTYILKESHLLMLTYKIGMTGDGGSSFVRYDWLKEKVSCIER